MHRILRKRYRCSFQCNFNYSYITLSFFHRRRSTSILNRKPVDKTNEKNVWAEKEVTLICKRAPNFLEHSFFQRQPPSLAYADNLVKERRLSNTTDFYRIHASPCTWYIRLYVPFTSPSKGSMSRRCSNLGRLSRISDQLPFSPLISEKGPD